MSPPDQAPNPPSCYTVLVVDSLPVDQELYQRYLLADSGTCYNFLEANSTTAAVSVCQSIQVDGVLVDSVSSVATGMELLEELEIRMDGYRPPVVIVAGESDPAAVVRAIKQGAEDYLVRQTLTAEQLQVAMRSAIENARLRLQLQHQEDRFRVSVENMLDCFGIYTAIRNEAGQIVDFRIDYLNTAALESNQMTPDDIGKGLCELLPAHRELGLFEEYCRVIETGEPLVKEDWIYTDVFGTDHITRAYDICANKLDDGFVASWRDVTARKQVELALQESEQRFRAIFNIAFQFVGLLSPDGILLEANQTALDFGGLTRESAVGRPFWEVRWWTISPQTQQQLQEAIARASQGEFVRYEVEVLGAGDQTTTIDFSLKPMRDESGRVVLLIPEGRDISDRLRNEGDRNRMEVALRQSEERFRLLATSAPIGIFQADSQGRCTYSNPLWQAISSLSAEESLGDGWSEAIHPEDREMMLADWQQAVADKRFWEYENRLLTQQGDVRWVRALASPIYASDEQLLGFVGVYRLNYAWLSAKCQQIRQRMTKFPKLLNPYPERLISFNLLLMPSTTPLVV